jgi:shikimate kinase/GNAT superfamily N-acetyltransferase
MTIRKYKPEDEHTVVEIWYQASLIAHDFVPADFWEQEKDVIRREYLPLSKTWVYEKDQQIVGMLSLSDGQTIGGLFVDPAWQGGGVGTQLINHAKSLRAVLFLDVFKQNERAIRFYQKCGFKIVDESIQPDTGCEQFTMVWQKEPARQNIVLTGFMGTGKSSVGRLLATKLGRKFVDIDGLIEQREGRTINQIFADEGEPYFRRLEAIVCRELAGQQGLVIATGGGALVPEKNLRIMDSTGLLICLDCEPEVLWERIGRSQNRPMLAANDQDRFTRLAALLEKRAPAYARIQHHLDVTHLSPREAVLAICQLLQLAS